MSRYWSKLVNELNPYIPGEQPQLDNLIKLNTNEIPFDPAPGVLTAIAAVSGNDLRRYPDPESLQLKNAFAELNGLRSEQVFLGNGSDEVLAHIFQALLSQDEPVCFPDISYSFYPVWCKLYQCDFVTVPLAEDFTIDLAAFPAKNGGIIIPNPNAPTGILLGLDRVRELLTTHRDSVVVIDEAYIDFGGESSVQLIDEFDNLMVVQTLSKSRALAGLRVGVAMGNSELIEGLERVKNSFNSYPMDVVAQAAALASLEDVEYFKESCDKVIGNRARLSQDMKGLGFEVLPSSANFVFVTHPDRDASEIFQALRDRGIVVRYFNAPRIDQFLRISVGNTRECDALMQAMEDILA